MTAAWGILAGGPVVGASGFSDIGIMLGVWSDAFDASIVAGGISLFIVDLVICRPVWRLPWRVAAIVFLGGTAAGGALGLTLGLFLGSILGGGGGWGSPMYEIVLLCMASTYLGGKLLVVWLGLRKRLPPLELRKLTGSVALWNVLVAMPIMWVALHAAYTHFWRLAEPILFPSAGPPH